MFLSLHGCFSLCIIILPRKAFPMKFSKTASDQADDPPQKPELACFVAMFRSAPFGASLFFENSPSWCIAIAKSAGRKIKTQKSISITRRGKHTMETTRVAFLDDPRKKPARVSASYVEDPRQILIPGVIA